MPDPDAQVAAALLEVETALAERGPGRLVPDRSRITALLDLLGNPQQMYSSIHVTGTNGKTSTAVMIDALLRAHGLRTGRYTSPHLAAVRERIVVDGEVLSPEAFVRAFGDVAPYVDMLDAERARGGDRVTYFELLTALALAAFADAPIQVAVVEVGMGGEWDATNVLSAPVAVVTPISADHLELLGPEIGDIAHEKAAIITEDAVAVLAAQPMEAATVLLERVAQVGATVAREGLEFGVRDRQVAVGGQLLQLQGLGAVYDEVFLPLHGAHQAENAAVALAAAEAFLGAGTDKALDAEVVREAFASVRAPGRLEVVRRSPTVVIDTAHNPGGMTASLEAVGDSFDFERLVVVLAVLGDKDVDGMLEALEPVADVLVVTANSAARAMPAQELAARAARILGEDRVRVAATLDAALEEAVRIVDEDPGAVYGGHGVLVTGSVVTAGEARVLLTGEQVA